MLLVTSFVEGTFSVVNTSLYTRKWIFFSGRPQDQAEEEEARRGRGRFIGKKIGRWFKRPRVEFVIHIHDKSNSE
jgi:hypothetical protein